MAIRPVPSLFQVLVQILAPTPEQRKEQIAFQMQFDKVTKCVQNTVMLIGTELWPPKGNGLEKSPKPDVPPKQDVVQHRPRVKLCEQVEVEWDVDPRKVVDVREQYENAVREVDPEKRMKLYQSIALRDYPRAQTKLRERYRTRGEPKDKLLASFWEAARARGLDRADLNIGGDVPSEERVTLYDASNAIMQKDGVILGLNKARLIPREEARESYGDCYQNMVRTDEFFKEAFKTELLPLQAYLYIKNGDEALWLPSIKSVCFGQVSKPAKEYCSFPEIVAHEFTHGFIEHTCGLRYKDESGALNESLADVFGIMMKHYLDNKSARFADWHVGLDFEGEGTYLRSIDKRPLQYWRNKIHVELPHHLKNYLHTEGDKGGVHTNSSIPNTAFYLAAWEDARCTWDRIGQIWFRAMLVTEPDDGFGAFALNTMKAAKPFGDGVVQRVGQAWQDVGVMHLARKTYEKIQRIPAHS